MALFFDAPWFDGALAKLGFSRDVLAAALGLARAELDEVFKDQRELSADEVRKIAAFLGADAETVATRAGVSTPRPSLDWTSAPQRAASRGAGGGHPAAGEDRIAALEQRVLRLETLVQRLLASRPRG